MLFWLKLRRALIASKRSIFVINLRKLAPSTTLRFRQDFRQEVLFLSISTLFADYINLLSEPDLGELLWRQGTWRKFLTAANFEKFFFFFSSSFFLYISLQGEREKDRKKEEKNYWQDLKKTKAGSPAGRRCGLSVSLFNLQLRLLWKSWANSRRKSRLSE